MNTSLKIGYQKSIIAGAIAGFVDGIVSYISVFIAPSLGLWEAIPGTLTFSYIIVQLSAQIPFNMMWGIVFGLVFAMIYDRIPSKGAVKGLIFALIFYWLLSNIRISQIMASFGEVLWPTVFIWGGFFASVAYGLVLGYLYKPKK